MYDTLAGVSPPLSTALLEDIRRALGCLRRTESDQSITFEIFTGQLVGSYEHRTSVRLIVDQDGRDRLRVEGSVHKAIAGTNILGGPSEVIPAWRWYVDRVGELIGVALPDGAAWRPHRVDIAQAFVLADLDHVREAVRTLQAASVTRRAKRNYGSETACFPGGRFTLKAYAKGPEFRVHDYSRMRDVLDKPGDDSGVVPDEVAQLVFDELMAEFGSMLGVEGSVLESAIAERIQNVNPVEDMATVADQILRVEVEIKRRALADLVGSEGTFWQLDDQQLRSIFWSEVEKIEMASRDEMKRVNHTKAVYQRLHEQFTPNQARALYGTWANLATLGEDRTRDMLPRSTFFDHKKKLKGAGCDWIGADIVERSVKLPSDFSIGRNSPYLLDVGEALEVEMALAPFRAA